MNVSETDKHLNTVNHWAVEAHGWCRSGFECCHLSGQTTPLSLSLPKLSVHAGHLELFSAYNVIQHVKAPFKTHLYIVSTSSQMLTDEVSKFDDSFAICGVSGEMADFGTVLCGIGASCN